MKIADVICSGGKTGFFFDDQKAIKMGAVPDGATYRGKPATAGFTAVRQAGESISVMLVLDHGQTAPRFNTPAPADGIRFSLPMTSSP